MHLHRRRNGKGYEGFAEDSQRFNPLKMKSFGAFLEQAVQTYHDQVEAEIIKAQ